MHRGRGFGLIEVVLILLFLVSAVTAGFIFLKSHVASTRAASQSDLLNQADKAIAGFAAKSFRLPCPDTAGSGVENCASGIQKGWLPYKTLGLEGYESSPALKYIVYRSASIDLSVASNRFDPHDWDGTSKNYNQVNGADLCIAIAQASQAGSSASTAHVVDGGNGLRQVAYALAHPGNGDADGDGNVFDGRNANTAPELEAPERGTALGNYDDQVITRSMSELAATADCKTVASTATNYLALDGNLTGSLDGLGLAADVVNEVNDQKIWTTVIASALTAVNLLKAGVAAVKMAIAIGALATSAGVLATAAGVLSAAIGSCAVIVGCFEIPHAAASVAAAAIAVGAGATAVAANAAAIVTLVVAAGLSGTAAIMAGVSIAPAPVDLTQQIADAQTAYQKAVADAATATTQLTIAQTNAATATAAESSAWTNILNTAHNLINQYNNPTPPNGGIMIPGSLSPAMVNTANDWLLNTLKTNAAALEQAKLNVSQAQSDLNTANKTVTDLTAAITTANNDIAATQAQIAATTDPVLLQTLQNKLASQQASLGSLQTQLAAAQTDVQSKTSALASAQAAQNTAQANYDSAQANAINAFNLSGTYQYTYNGSTPNNSPCGGNNQPTCQAPNNSPCGGSNQPACAYTWTATATSAVNGTGSISSAILTWWPLYETWYPQNSIVAKKQQSLDAANNTVTQTKAAYDSLVAIKNGAAPTGTAVNAWSGADAILKAADSKGALQ